MFKPKKKINENAVKKDFFKVVKKEKGVDYVVETDIAKTEFLIIDKFKENINFPKKGTILNILTTKNNSIVDLIKGQAVEELIVICSRIDIKSIDKIKDIENKYLILSDVVRDRKPEIYRAAESSFKNIIVCRNHAKMLLFKIKDNYYVCQTSANPSINARNEFYNIYNDENAYKKIIECSKIKETSKA